MNLVNYIIINKPELDANKRWMLQRFRGEIAGNELCDMISIPMYYVGSRVRNPIIGALADATR